MIMLDHMSSCEEVPSLRANYNIHTMLRGLPVVRGGRGKKIANIQRHYFRLDGSVEHESALKLSFVVSFGYLHNQCHGLRRCARTIDRMLLYNIDLYLCYHHKLTLSYMYCVQHSNVV
jgi:hypothetical protein